MTKNVLCSQAQIEHMTTAKSCCLNHSRQKYRGEGRLVHPKYREILQCKSLLSLLFCYKCLYFYRQDSRLSCPKYSSLFVFVSSRMHAEEGLQLDETKTAASDTIEIVGCDTHEKKKQKKKTKKQRKERKTSGQLHARKVVCTVTSRNASYMIGRGQMLPPPFRRGSCWPLGIPIKISFPFPIFHQSAYDTKRPARWRREGQIKAGFHQRPSRSRSRNQKIQRRQRSASACTYVPLISLV